MAHDSNGLIFIDTSGATPIGISVSDCQAVFATSRNTFGDVITNENINKWAKYKPIKRSGLHFSDQLNADMTWKSTADWWKGTDGQCGLTFDTYDNIGSQTIATTGFLHDLITTSPSWALAWGYERPTGNINRFPFRRRDFNYYDHSAPKPVTGVFDNLRLYGGGKLTVQLDEQKASNGRGIELSDLTINTSAVSGWYVGILIYKSANQYAFAFSDNTLGNGADSVEFTGMTNYQGTVTIVPFLSSVRWTPPDPELSGVFLSCDVAPEEVTIQAEQQHRVTMSIDAQWRFALPGPVKYDIRIINDSGSTISVTNMYIDLYDGDPLDGGVRIDRKSVSDFYLANEGIRDETGTLQANPYDSTKTYYVVVSSSRTEVNGKAAVEQFRG